jgi:hypothetical protein
MQQSWDNIDARDDENEIRYSLTALGEAALEDVRAGVPSFCGFEPCVAPIGQVADAVAAGLPRLGRQGIPFAHRGARP